MGYPSFHQSFSFLRPTLNFKQREEVGARRRRLRVNEVDFKCRETVRQSVCGECKIRSEMLKREAGWKKGVVVVVAPSQPSIFRELAAGWCGDTVSCLVLLHT